MSKLQAMDQLPLGSPVVVQGKYGHVVKVEIVPAHPIGMIVVHTIEFTHRRIFMHTEGWSGRKVYEFKALKKPKRERVNYAFITPLEREYL